MDRKQKRYKRPGDYLYSDQRDSVNEMHNGCLLVGGVGAGKSITSLAYYFEKNGGSVMPYEKMRREQDLVIITTAKKREDRDWEREMIPFLIQSSDIYPSLRVNVDSWQNIRKYKDRKGAFFIFDEDHLVGSGAWVKAFYEIAKHNEWIVLSATPADSYIEFVPIFVANGYFKNKREFIDNHVIYDPHCKLFPKIKGYYNTGRLIRLKDRVVVRMNYLHESEVHEQKIACNYDILGYKEMCRDKWNKWKDKPMENAAEFCYCLRRLVNSDASRILNLLDILREKHRVIVFYSCDYELDILKSVDYSAQMGTNVEVAELNGHLHQTVPETEWWVYLVNYAAGAEAWECTSTDTIIFYSQTYSYKTLVQAKGRIDRCNTPYSDLYYYHFVSGAKIDLAIGKALLTKKKFNETMFSSKCGFAGKN